MAGGERWARATPIAARGDRTDSGSYELWLAARPTIRGVGATADAAFDALCRRINAEGDYSPEFDFDPPLPTVPLPTVPLPAGIDKDSYVSLWPGGGLQVRNPPRALFDGPDCRVCGYNQPARRTDVPLAADPTANSAVGTQRDGDRDGWCLTLADDFVRQLTSDERQAFTQRPVALPPRSRRNVRRDRSGPTRTRVRRPWRPRRDGHSL